MARLKEKWKDDHPYRAAVFLGLAVTAGSMVWSIFIWPKVHPIPPYAYWDAPPDVWHVLLASHWLLHADIFRIYEAGSLWRGGSPTGEFATGQFEAGPLFPILLTPIAFLGERLNLSEWVIRWNPRPTMWLVYGPYATLISCIPFLYAIRSFAVTAGLKKNLLRLQGVTGALVLVPVVGYFGHFDDALALTFVVLSARDLNRKRWIRAAVMLGLAVGFKQWAWIALPMLLAATPKEERGYALIPSVAAPAAFFAMTLAIDWPFASQALLKADTCPACGHSALWVSAQAMHFVGGPLRSGVFIVAALIAWRMRERHDASSLAAAIGVGLLARVAFEPVVYFYQVAAALPFLAMYEQLEDGRPWRTLVLGGVMLPLFAFHPESRDFWWLLFTPLTVALAWPAARRIVETKQPPPTPRSGIQPKPPARKTPAAGSTRRGGTPRRTKAH